MNCSLQVFANMLSARRHSVCLTKHILFPTQYMSMSHSKACLLLYSVDPWLFQLGLVQVFNPLRNPCRVDTKACKIHHNLITLHHTYHQLSHQLVKKVHILYMHVLV